MKFEIEETQNRLSNIIMNIQLNKVIDIHVGHDDQSSCLDKISSLPSCNDLYKVVFHGANENNIDEVIQLIVACTHATSNAIVVELVMLKHFSVRNINEFLYVNDTALLNELADSVFNKLNNKELSGTAVLFESLGYLSFATEKPQKINTMEIEPSNVVRNAKEVNIAKLQITQFKYQYQINQTFQTLIQYNGSLSVNVIIEQFQQYVQKLIMRNGIDNPHVENLPNASQLLFSYRKHIINDGYMYISEIREQIPSVLLPASMN